MFPLQGFITFKDIPPKAGECQARGGAVKFFVGFCRMTVIE